MQANHSGPTLNNAFLCTSQSIPHLPDNSVFSGSMWGEGVDNTLPVASDWMGGLPGEREEMRLHRFPGGPVR